MGTIKQSIRFHYEGENDVWVFSTNHSVLSLLPTNHPTHSLSHLFCFSMTKVKDHDRKPNLHFHRTGLNTTDETNKMGWRMRTFSSILKENGHSQVGKRAI